MNLLKDKHVAVIGLGSGGSAVADMLVRAGIGKLTLIDPDLLEYKNLERHILTREYVGKPKVEAMKEHFKKIITIPITWGCSGAARRAERERLETVHGPFDTVPMKPGLIACCADSDKCCQLVNDYSLREGIPAVYGAVHGDAHTAEIITVIPGETPCYACYEREGTVPEPSQAKYTDPNYDPTQMPHQEGLWCDVLMAASLQLQAILGVIGSRERISPLALFSLRTPFKANFITQTKGCAVCSNDFSALEVAL